MTPELKAAAKDAYHTAIEGPCLTDNKLMWDTAVSWLYEHLSKGVGEFDFDAFANEYGKLIDLGDWLKSQHIARWQFDQMRARVGLAEIAYKDADFLRADNLKQIKALTAERDELLERLNTVNDTNKLRQMTIQELQDHRDELKAKLAIMAVLDDRRK